MDKYRYVDIENDCLRLKLDNNRIAAKEIATLIQGGGYLSKAKISIIQEHLNRIIKG